MKFVVWDAKAVIANDTSKEWLKGEIEIDHKTVDGYNTIQILKKTPANLDIIPGDILTLGN
jgi:hypothetical protein